MTADEQPQKLSEESCADFVDRIQLEGLNRRWASVVMGGRRSRQWAIPSPEAEVAQVAPPATENRAD